MSIFPYMCCGPSAMCSRGPAWIQVRAHDFSYARLEPFLDLGLNHRPLLELSTGNRRQKQQMICIGNARLKSLLPVNVLSINDKLNSSV